MTREIRASLGGAVVVAHVLLIISLAAWLVPMAFGIVAAAGAGDPRGYIPMFAGGGLVGLALLLLAPAAAAIVGISRWNPGQGRWLLVSGDLAAITLATMVFTSQGAGFAGGLSIVAIVTFGVGSVAATAAGFGIAPAPANRWRYRR